MFDRACDNVISLVPVGKGITSNGEVIAFSTAAGKVNLKRLTVDRVGNLLTRVFNRHFCLDAKGMAAGRVTKMIVKKRRHCVGDFFCDRRGGVIAEVNRLIWRHSSSFLEDGYK